MGRLVLLTILHPLSSILVFPATPATRVDTLLPHSYIRPT
jgi:hypothetical protein